MSVAWLAVAATAVARTDRPACGTFLGNWTIDPAATTRFVPYGVAVDRGSSVYVTDAADGRVEKLAPDGTWLADWGTEGSAEAGFHLPRGIAVDRGGHVYAVDLVIVLSDRLLGGRVVHFDRAGRFVRAWGYDGGPERLVGPVAVATDRHGFVYVADDFGYRVAKFRRDGRFVRAWGTYGEGPGEFQNVGGVAVDRRGHVYATDTRSHRVQKFTRRGRFVDAWSTAAGSVDFPGGIAVDRRGNVFVTDYVASRVAKFDAHGRLRAAWASAGSGDGQLQFPAGIAVDDRHGRVLVADSGNGRIVTFACR